jgi:hypothetical protein
LLVGGKAHRSLPGALRCGACTPEARSKDGELQEAGTSHAASFLWKLMCVVWLDFRKELYYLKRQKRFAQGSTESFVCLDEARSNGYRRSLLGRR